MFGFLFSVDFFGRVLESMSSNSWGPAPYLYICQALSHVPESPLLDTAGVLNLRYISKLTSLINFTAFVNLDLYE